MLSTVKYSMDNKLQALIVSITLAFIWYVIYVWLLTRAIGSLSGLCIYRLSYSSYYTHLVWRFERSLYSTSWLRLKDGCILKSILTCSILMPFQSPTYSVISCPISLNMIQSRYGVWYNCTGDQWVIWTEAAMTSTLTASMRQYSYWLFHNYDASIKRIYTRRSTLLGVDSAILPFES